MRSRSRLLGVLLPGLLALASLGVAACGSSSKSSSLGGGGSSGGSAPSSSVSAEVAKFAPLVKAPANAKKGGTLTVIAKGDVDYIDPGATYSQWGLRGPLGGGLAADGLAAQRDLRHRCLILAASQPTLSDGGKTITFKIKPNIHYSPPMGGGPGWSKPVVSHDVKYAIERGLMPGVPNGYLTVLRRRPGRTLAGGGRGQEGPDQGARTSAASRRRTLRRSCST